jgi:hypothetical protein
MTIQNYKGDKFVFHEFFTNSDGKQSGSGFIGFYLGIIAGLCFVAAMIGYFLKMPDTVNVMEQIIILCGIAGGLLGVRKVISAKVAALQNETITETSTSTTVPPIIQTPIETLTETKITSNPVK